MFFPSLLEGSQRLGPEAIEVRAQRIEGLGIERVQTPGSRGPIRDQMGALEHAKVLGDGRPAHWEVTSELSDGQRAPEQAREDGAAGGIAEGIELRVVVSNHLR